MDGREIDMRLAILGADLFLLPSKPRSPPASAVLTLWVRLSSAAFIALRLQIPGVLGMLVGHRPHRGWQ